MPPVSSQPGVDPARPLLSGHLCSLRLHPPFQPRRGITDSSSQELIKGLLSVTFSGTSFNILSICPHSQSREKLAT